LEPSPQPPSTTLWASLSQWERGYGSRGCGSSLAQWTREAGREREGPTPLQLVLVGDAHPTISRITFWILGFLASTL